MKRGVWTALVTPFITDGLVDYSALERLLEFQIAGGVKGIVPTGTTGESATLSMEEKKEIIRFVVQVVNGRVSVVAGTGANRTDSAIELTRYAKELGVDGVLIVAPYYNKPTQKGLFEHYTKIADTVEIPIFVYNIPSRTGVNITADTLIRLSQHQNIVGVKEASGDMDQVMQIFRDRDPDFWVLSGDDSLNFILCALGSEGVISVLSNLIPKETVSMVDDCFQGNWNQARSKHFHFLNLISALFMETNPIPIKTALHKIGLCSDVLRLPLTSMSDKNQGILKEILQKYGILNR